MRHVLPIGTTVHPLYECYDYGSGMRWRQTNQDLTKEVVVHTIITPPDDILAQFPHGIGFCMYLFPTPLDDTKLNNLHGKIVGFVYMAISLTTVP